MNAVDAMLQGYLEGEGEEMDFEGMVLEDFVYGGRYGEYGAMQVLGEGGEDAIEELESLLSPWDLLAPYRVPITPTEALACLDTVLDPIRLLVLYKHYFPEEFARSTADMLPRGYAYSSAEIEFFRLVNDRLFPLWDHVIMWNLESGERAMTIPCEPQAMEVYNRSVEDFRPGWHLLFILERVERPDDLPPQSPLQEWVDELWEYVEWLPKRYVGPFTLQQLDDLAQTLEGPLKHLPLAVRVLHEDAGNAWLDIDQETAMQAQDVYWTHHWVDVLTEEWDEAKAILEQVAELTEWLEEDPANQRQLFELYQRGMAERLAVQDEEETERIRVRA